MFFIHKKNHHLSERCICYIMFDIALKWWIEFWKERFLVIYNMCLFNSGPNVDRIPYKNSLYTKGHMIVLTNFRSYEIFEANVGRCYHIMYVISLIGMVKLFLPIFSMFTGVFFLLFDVFSHLISFFEGHHHFHHTIILK